MDEWSDDLWNARERWGRRVFGGQLREERPETQRRTDLEHYERIRARLYAEQELHWLDERVGRQVDDEQDLSLKVAHVDALIEDTKRSLRALDLQREEAEEKAYADARAQELRERLGITSPRPPFPQSLEQIREEAHDAERARQAAQPKLSKQQLDAIDPNGPNAKALLKAQQDAVDPVVQAARHNAIPSALDAEAGRVDRWTPVPEQADIANPPRKFVASKRVTRVPVENRRSLLGRVKDLVR